MSTPQVIPYETALAEYQTYSEYFITGSIDSCRRFIRACTILISFPSTDSVGGIAGTSVTISVAEIRAQQDKAEKWLAASLSGGSGMRVRPVSYNGGRGPLW